MIGVLLIAVNLFSTVVYVLDDDDTLDQRVVRGGYAHQPHAVVEDAKYQGTNQGAAYRAHTAVG